MINKSSKAYIRIKKNLLTTYTYKCDSTYGVAVKRKKGDKVGGNMIQRRIKCSRVSVCAGRQRLAGNVFLFCLHLGCSCEAKFHPLLKTVFSFSAEVRQVVLVPVAEKQEQREERGEVNMTHADRLQHKEHFKVYPSFSQLRKYTQP